MPSTANKVLRTIRELSFDRFVTPCFFLAHKTPSSETDAAATKWSFEIDADGLYIYDKTDPDNIVEHEILFEENQFPTLEAVLQKIISLALPVQVIYSGSFIPTEPSSSFLPVAETVLGSLYHPLFRKQYFSDEYIFKKFVEYADLVMNATDEELIAVQTGDQDDNWDDLFEGDGFDLYRERHMTLWVAYHLVGDRRLYELAAQNLLQNSLFGGNPLLNGATSFISNSSFSMTGPGESVQVRIGDVFTLEEDNTTSLGIHNGGEIPKDMLPPWAVGSDNQLMDYYSFWYRLQLWIRDKFEQTTNDYSLRKNQVMTGKIHLDPRDSHKWLSYFDSYPWVFSPYARGIYDNKGIQNLGT